MAEFDPVVLRYAGLDTESQVIDLGQLAQSLAGASKLLATAGHIVVAGQFVKKTPALSVRVLAGTPGPGSYEVPATLMTVGPVVAPFLPIIKEAAKHAATKAVTAIVNYVVAHYAAKPEEKATAYGVAQAAIQEMGQTSRAAMDAVERMAMASALPVRNLVSPVGASCETIQLGAAESAAFLVDRAARAAIEAPEPVVIGAEMYYEIRLSELDLKTRSCKFSLRDEEDPDKRYAGEIVDPILQVAGNPYSAALDKQAWLVVNGKPSLKEGDLDRLYILGIPPEFA